MAIVWDDGSLKDSDTFIDYISKTDDNSSKIVSSSDGKYAELSYRVLERDEKNSLSLVDIELKTGRHHQIRVQFSSRNHPLFGDQRYGKRDNNQIALHAYQIEFIHPTTKEKMIFVSKPNRESKWINFNI